MDFTINKKNVKSATFVDYEMEYDTVVIPYETGSLRYPYVHVVEYTDSEKTTPVTSPITGRGAGTYRFVYSEEESKWEFENGYYTKQELLSTYGVYYWLVGNLDAEKVGDEICIYKVLRGNVWYYSADYKRTGKTYYAKKRLGMAGSIHSQTPPLSVGISASNIGIIAKGVIGKEPYSYKFDGLVYPPYLRDGDYLRYGGKSYGNGNSVIKFGVMPVASIEYPESGESDSGLDVSMNSTDASVARDAAEYEDLMRRIQSLDESTLPRYNSYVSDTQNDNKVCWSVSKDVNSSTVHDVEVYIGRYTRQGVKVVAAPVMYLDNNIQHCYFGGHVYAGMIQTGIVNNVNVGYINSGMCDSSITGPISSINAISQGYSERTITYKDENGDNQTITVLAKNT